MRQSQEGWAAIAAILSEIALDRFFREGIYRNCLSGWMTRNFLCISLSVLHYLQPAPGLPVLDRLMLSSWQRGRPAPKARRPFFLGRHAKSGTGRARPVPEQPRHVSHPGKAPPGRQPLPGPMAPAPALPADAVGCPAVDLAGSDGAADASPVAGACRSWITSSPRHVRKTRPRPPARSSPRTSR